MLQLFGILLMASIVIAVVLGLAVSHWWIGGLFALFMFSNAFDRYKESKLTDEQWHAKYPDKTERNDSKGSIILFSVVGLIFCVAAYFPIYQQAEAEKRDIERVSQLSAEERKIFDEHFQEHMQEKNSDEVSARKQALEDVDKILLSKAEAERKAREAEEENRKNIELVNQLSDVNRNYFDEKFQEYINNSMGENSARKKVLTDVDAMLKAQAEEERKAAEEEQARLIAEQKAREEEQARLAAEQKSREETERKALEQSQPVTVAQGFISIESLESVNENVLADQVIEYINANPDKKGRLISYIFNLELLSNRYNAEIERISHSDGEAIANSIPLIDGLIVDKSWNSITEGYKRAIVNEINNDSVMRSILDARYASHTLRDAAYNVLSNMYLINTNDIDNCNALIKIAAIKHHAVEAYVEDHKGRLSLDPGVFDVIDIVFYAVFSAKENRGKYNSAQQALNRISAALSLDTNKCRTKEEMEKYFASLIPRYMFPYELEEIYSPADKNAVFTDNNAKADDRKRVYEMLRGTWHSLITDKTAVIETFPENDYSAKAPRVNFIDVLDKKEPYARFNYIFPSGNRVNCFITPALYVKDGRKTKVLVMYSNYELIKGGESSIYKNGRVENVLSAEDVFIREID